MKTFSKFIDEASRFIIAPSKRAKMLGLKGDGHGGWYHRGTHEFEAKTDSRQPLGLRFFNKNHTQVVGGKDAPSKGREGQIASRSWVAEQQLPPEQLPPEQLPPEQLPPEQLPVEELPPPNYLPVEKTKGVLTIAFGGFNPPSLAHQELLDVASMSAEEVQGDYVVVPSRSYDPKKNPLDPDTKISYMRLMYPNHAERIVNDPNQVTIFDSLIKAHNDGYSSIRIIIEPSRVKEFQKLADTHNGDLYEFEMIEVFPSGETNPDGKEMEEFSSARMRLAAAEGDLVTFRNSLPQMLSRKQVIQLFDTVRAGMGILEIQQEGYNVWEIAPEFDLDGLRENYVEGNILNVGDLVENLNTGMSGKIIRRGANHLICVTEDGMMFKSWIKDVSYNK